MRSALALSALLLLLPPLPTLSEEEEEAITTRPATTSQPNPVPTTAGQNITTSAGNQSVSLSVPGVALTSAPQSVETASSGGGKKTDTSTMAGGPKPAQDSGQMPPTPTSTTKPKQETTSAQHEMNTTASAGAPRSVPTNTVTTKQGHQANTQPPYVVSSPASTSPAPPAPPLSTSSTHQPTPTPGPVTPNPPGSSPEGPTKMTTAPRSPGASPTGSAGTSQGTSTPPAPLVTSQGSQPTSSHVPATTGTLSSAAGTSPGASTTEPPPPPQPTAPSSGPTATSPVGPPGPSTPLAPTAPQDANVPSSPSAPGHERVECGPPERLTEKMLILNLTKTSLCAGGPKNPHDKLVMLLCRAAKAGFNPSRDQCDIHVVPDAETEAVAIKNITMRTILLPTDLFEAMRDKWDDLKEVGVTHMKFGAQGPPEETEDRFSMPLIITIVSMASFLLLVAALYGCCHQRLSQRKDQQRLTEELQTVENGYHDNPTLEVMETSSEMQEKKVVSLNGELGDSWIVPLDNLIKDDLDEEEDTHL